MVDLQGDKVRLECVIEGGFQWFEVVFLKDGIEVGKTGGYPTAQEALEAAEDVKNVANELFARLA